MARKDGSSSVQIAGLRETVRSLEQFGVTAQDLKDAFSKIGALVAGDAKAITPTLSGALANSIKPSKTKNRSDVRAGSARVPYAGVINYGGYNNIEAVRFLNRAVESNQEKAMRLIDDELGDLIAKYDLK